MAIFETKKACMYFGGLKAVDDVSVAVKEGQIFGIIGPNGAGKSTFFNLCSGGYIPTRGQVFLNGKEITNLSPNQIVRLGMARTFQNIKLFNNMSVLDNVKAGFHIHETCNIYDAIVRNKRYRENEEKVRINAIRLLEKVGLSQYSDTKAGNLSYGIQRKLEIARALATSPKLLLLDEPAAGMNPQETIELSEFVRMINSFGITVVVIEHDMKFIMSICDRIMVLNYGKKLFEGTPNEVKHNNDVIEAYFGANYNADNE